MAAFGQASPQVFLLLCCSLDFAALQLLLQVPLPGGGGVEVALSLPMALECLLAGWTVDASLLQLLQTSAGSLQAVAPMG